MAFDHRIFMGVSICLLLAGCRTPTSAPEPAEQAGARVDSPQIEASGSSVCDSEAPAYVALDVRDVTIALDDSPNYEGVVVYPQLESEDTAEQRAFNQHVAKRVGREVARFKDFCKAEARRRKVSDKPLGYGLRCEYEMCFASAEFVSLTLTWASFTGYVNEDYFTVPITFDLRTGRPVELRQLFRKGSKYLEPISAYCIARLNEQHPDPAWDLDKSAGPSSDNYDTWCVTREGLTITFGEYQVGPGRLGLVSIQIPYEILADIADPLGALTVAAGSSP